MLKKDDLFKVIIIHKNQGASQILSAHKFTTILPFLSTIIAKIDFLGYIRLTILNLEIKNYLKIGNWKFKIDRYGYQKNTRNIEG